jgi:hypothetical protein
MTKLKHLSATPTTTTTKKTLTEWGSLTYIAKTL